MIERAEWRRETLAPRTPMGIFLGRDQARGIPVGWLVFGASLLYMVVRLALDALLVKWLAELLGLLAFAPALLLFAVVLGPSRSLESLSPDPAPGPSFSAALGFFRGLRKTGDDQGALAFVDGWLVYEGRETSFALRAADVREIVRVSARWCLVLDEGQRLEIEVLRERVAFADALDLWRDGPSPLGLSRLPPLQSRYPARLKVAASLHALGPLVLGVGVAFVLKDVVMGTWKPSQGTFLGALVAVAVVLSGLGRLLMWDDAEADEAKNEDR